MNIRFILDIQEVCHKPIYWFVLFFKTTQILSKNICSFLENRINFKNFTYKKINCLTVLARKTPKTYYSVFKELYILYYVIFTFLSF